MQEKYTVVLDTILYWSKKPYAYGVIVHVFRRIILMSKLTTWRTLVETEVDTSTRSQCRVTDYTVRQLLLFVLYLN